MELVVCTGSETEYVASARHEVSASAVYREPRAEGPALEPDKRLSATGLGSGGMRR